MTNSDTNNIIVEKLFGESSWNESLNKNDYKIGFSLNILIKTLLIIIILKFFLFETYIALIIGIIYYYYAYTNYINEYIDKINFLNYILENRNTYLHYDKNIVDFYYNNRFYIDNDLSNYRDSLKNTNLLLTNSYNIQNNIMNYPEQLFENSYIYYKEALNYLHSTIYKLTSQCKENNLYYNNLTTLKYLLDKHINIISNIIKAKLPNVNINSIINPSNIHLQNDIDDKYYYNPHFSFF